MKPRGQPYDNSPSMATSNGLAVCFSADIVAAERLFCASGPD